MYNVHRPLHTRVCNNTEELDQIRPYPTISNNKFKDLSMFRKLVEICNMKRPKKKVPRTHKTKKKINFLLTIV